MRCDLMRVGGLTTHSSNVPSLLPSDLGRSTVKEILECRDGERSSRGNSTLLRVMGPVRNNRTSRESSGWSLTSWMSSEERIWGSETSAMRLQEDSTAVSSGFFFLGCAEMRLLPPEGRRERAVTAPCRRGDLGPERSEPACVCSISMTGISDGWELEVDWSSESAPEAGLATLSRECRSPAVGCWATERSSRSLEEWAMLESLAEELFSGCC